MENNNIENLKEYKEKLSKLTEEENKQRDLYLQQLANGELQGPPVGYQSIDKTWLKYFGKEDLNYEIPDDSIYQYMYKCCKNFKDEVAMEYMNFSVDYNTLFKKIDEVARSLKALGIKSGDTVSVCLPNIPEVAYVFYAINKIGAVANMLDPRTNDSTLQDCIVDSNSKFLLSLDSICEKFANIIDNTELEKVVSISALESLPKPIQFLAKRKDKSLAVEMPKDKRFIKWKDFLKQGKKYTGEIDGSFEKNSAAVIAYTGGTTGKPKGVIASNKNLVAMVVENSKENYGVNIGDRCLNIAPPWTYYGLSNCLNAFICMGGRTIMVPKLGPNDLGKLINKYKPNHVITVPSALLAVMKETELQNQDLSYLKTVIVGADKLTTQVETDFNNFLKGHNSACLVSKGYGMTEVTAAATYTKSNINVPGSVGIPFVAENVAIFNPETGAEVLTGESGEVAIKGPKNMKGYFGSNEEHTASVLKEHSDGTIWAHTSDIGHMDKDGNLYIDGRIKRMFVKNGFKLFAPEIESNIMKHNAVEQCAVVPVPDKENGSIAKAFIVLKEQYKLVSNDIELQIIEILRNSMYDYEIPDLFEFRDSLPLTGMNKIDFTALEKEEKEKIEQAKGMKK